MNDRIKRLLKKYHLKVAYLPIEKKGYLVHTSKEKPNCIFINSSLSEIEAETVILHEIGHAKKDNMVAGNYSLNYITRVKCECGAEDYMIEKMVEEQAKLNYDVSTINYVNFAESLGTQNYSKVRAELNKYILEDKNG